MPRAASRERSRERDDRRREKNTRRERSRERSPVRHERDRDRQSRGTERDRERDRHRDRDRDRDREKDRDRGRDRGRPRDSNKNDSHRSSRDAFPEERDARIDRLQPGVDNISIKEPRPEIRKKAGVSMPIAASQIHENGSTEEAALNLDADISPEEMQMMQAMGIPFGFNTTQGQHIQDEAVNTGAIKVKQKRRARQYMNRRGGFNRALPPERTGETALRD